MFLNGFEQRYNDERNYLYKNLTKEKSVYTKNLIYLISYKMPSASSLKVEMFFSMILISVGSKLLMS